MLTPPGRLAPGRWRFRMRPPLRPGASQPTLWPHPSPKPQPRPPRAPPDIPRPLPVPSAVHRPSSAACRPPSIRRLWSALHRPHSFIRSPFVDGLPPPASKAHPPPSAICRPPSTFVYSFPIRWRSALPSPVRRPHSFIRSPFVDGLPRHLPSAVHIRLFVPHSLTVCPAVRGPPSAVHIRLFVPIRWRSAPPSAVRRPFIPASW